MTENGPLTADELLTANRLRLRVPLDKIIDDPAATIRERLDAIVALVDLLGLNAPKQTETTFTYPPQESTHADCNCNKTDGPAEACQEEVTGQ